jgi:hypothetical protein
MKQKLDFYEAEVDFLDSIMLLTEPGTHTHRSGIHFIDDHKNRERCFEITVKELDMKMRIEVKDGL